MLKKEALKKMITGTVQERLYLAEQDFSLFFTYYYLDYIKYTFAPFHSSLLLCFRCSLHIFE